MAEHDFSTVAFPHAQRGPDRKAGELRRGADEELPDGKALFKVGERDFKFFVVKCGEVEIIDESGDTPKTLTVHRPGEFTGDVAQLTGSPAVVGAIARGDMESDPQVGQLLKGFGVSESETPAVACARMLLLRNPSNRELAEEIGIRQVTAKCLLIATGTRLPKAKHRRVRRLLRRDSQ